MLEVNKLYSRIKEYFFSFIILITIFLTIINFCFLFEFYNNEDLRDFYYKQELLDNKFSEIEVSHLEDVKDLSVKLLIINLILIVVSFFVVKDANRILDLLFFLVLILFIIVIFFDYFFFNIHYLLFDNLNWQLSESSLLLQTYPMSYFRSMFIMILALFILFSFILNCVKTRYFK